MEKNCHHAEAKILSIIHNWHKAVDGRGLSEDTRAQYCKDMMTWLPYLDQDHDYSTIDVNRYCIMPTCTSMYLYVHVLVT